MPHVGNVRDVLARVPGRWSEVMNKHDLTEFVVKLRNNCNRYHAEWVFSFACVILDELDAFRYEGLISGLFCRENAKSVIFIVAEGAHRGQAMIVDFNRGGSERKTEAGSFEFYSFDQRGGDPLASFDESCRGGGEVHDFLYKLLNADEAAAA